MVDDEDFEKLNQYKWHAAKDGDRFYAKRSTQRPNQATIRMHREIMGTPKDMKTDHIDGNGLNNCKSNLRIVTNRQNAQNRHDNISSKFPGVSWSNREKRWVARIKINGKIKHLGYFKVEAEAYNAYLKALEGIGEICVHNIIERGVEHDIL